MGVLFFGFQAYRNDHLYRGHRRHPDRRGGCLLPDAAAGGLGRSRAQQQQRTVAVIYLTGEIGFGDSSSLTGGSSTDQTMQDLERATDDPGLKAVVLRIDSPGGSPAASQELNEQVQRLKESGKKVVVSCGDLAASGGYYVAVAADKIVADPATLTGSIGVISTVPNLQDLYSKIGYKEQVFKSGPHKDMLSPSRPITPEEAADHAGDHRRHLRTVRAGCGQGPRHA